MEEEDGSAGPPVPLEGATEQPEEDASDDDESDDEENADDGPEDEGLQIPVSHELVLEGAVLLRSYFRSCTTKYHPRHETCSRPPVQAIERL